MSEPPRRRRSTQPPSRRPPQRSSVLPTIALGIGVVVAGLGIGAFLSAVQHKDNVATTASSASTPRGLAVVTPVARPTRGPIAIATIVGHPTPSPSPMPSPTPRATPTAHPSATPRPTPSPSASATPTASPSAPATATARASTPPQAAASPRATTSHAAGTPTPVVITPRPATPRPATPVPTPLPTVAPREFATAMARATPAGFGGLAQSTVRRYLSDLIAGNENAAYAELGRAPAESGASLSEEAFIDRGTRITSIRTTSSDAAGATVEVELRSGSGSYYATYHVTNGPSGPVIDQHDYIKV